MKKQDPREFKGMPQINTIANAVKQLWKLQTELENEVQQIAMNRQMGFITWNEMYNQMYSALNEYSENSANPMTDLSEREATAVENIVDYMKSNYLSPPE